MTGTSVPQCLGTEAWQGARRLREDMDVRSNRWFDAQHRDLKAAGCKKIFAEQVSSVAEREQLKAAIDYLREGDVLVSTKLHRLARSMRHLIDIVDEVKERGASLRVLGINLDTDTATAG